jgi:hypothetical protein
VSRRADSYGYDRDDTARFERFELEPLAPARIDTRIEAGAVLETTDIPAYLDRGLVVETDTGAALYRLVQLFGTPNVPGTEAGGAQRDRTVTTWQYLFALHDDPDDGPERDLLVSIYDYKTDVSVGLSGWRSPGATDGDAGGDGDGDGNADPDGDGTVDPNDSGRSDGHPDDGNMGENGTGPAIEPPTGAVGRSTTMPEADVLVLIVQLVCNVVEEPVPATHKGLLV